MTKTNAAPNPVLIATLSRAYDRAIRAEENAGTERQAWRLAAESERALRRLQAARAGLPLPAVNGPRNPRQAALTARQVAADALAALATLGRSIARALTAAAALRKAQAANALRRAAAATVRVSYRALRSVISAIAKLALTPTMAAPTAWSRTPSSMALALAVSPSSMIGEA